MIAIVRGSIACPVEALKAWRDAADITTGPLFRRSERLRARCADFRESLRGGVAIRCRIRAVQLWAG
jgi:hypothetical protein